MAQSFLQRAQREGTPLIDGTTVTFIWKGDTPPYLKADFTHWRRETTPPVAPEQVAPAVWAYRVTLPEDAYVEYAFFGDPADEKSRLSDPMNRRQVSNGVGQYNNYIAMPTYQPTTWHRPRRNVPRGTVTRHTLTIEELVVGRRRDLWLYQPPVDVPTPLLFVYDGADYYRRAKLPTIVDNLIAAGKMTPVALAMPQNAGVHRFMEYHTSEAMLATLAPIYEVARQHLNLTPPGDYGVMGASLGGLMALFTGLRMPRYFSKVLSQAGGFNIAPAPGTESLIFELVRLYPQHPLTIWQDVGTLDWLLESNREMRDLLLQKGYAVTYREYAAGHNFTAWRDALPDALMTLFPPTA